MASLREIKDHIASVRSTLKITSAMKLVASAKLRKAQQAPEQYGDLIVRVAGYSTYFVLLTNAVQNEIIDRTEQIL